MENLAEKIKSCKTMPELDELRIEIVKDKENFIVNQKAFISKKNKLKRIPLKDRTW